VESVAFSSDGQTLASGGRDNAIKLWDVRTGKLLRNFNGHEGWIQVVAFSPDGKTVLSGSTDRSIRLWNVASGEELRSFAANDLNHLPVNP
jgi:WD40 repeat protein